MTKRCEQQAALMLALDAVERLLDASVALLKRLDCITTDEFSKGGERTEREALREAIIAAYPPEIEEMEE